MAAPLKILGKAATELQLRKQTNIGMDLPFQWDEVDTFVRQPDGSLFSWPERFCCYYHLIYGTVNRDKSTLRLSHDEKEICWEVGESLLGKLEAEGIVKEVFPLHDERKRKYLLRNWALNWRDFTTQPIDDIYSYFGTKIATYFAFLGMYTRWLLFPAALGVITHLINFGPLQLFVLPVFFITIITWSVLLFQFWKRKNAALLTRWKVNYPAPGHRPLEKDSSMFDSSSEVMKKKSFDKVPEKKLLQREEWFGRLMRLRNDFMVILGIILLQLPFELAYAHIYQALTSGVLKFCATITYLFIIQYLKRFGGKVSVKLVEDENIKEREYRADSLIYKVFGLYFMQSYVGLFYQALRYRDLLTLRQVLLQRLIFSEVVNNLLENSIPYMKYSFKKYRTALTKKKSDKGSLLQEAQSIPRAEKDYLKPVYSASIGDKLEDGLFDDFLELTLQFGTIMMFACAFPLAFAFAALNNITEIRTDAVKLLAMSRRPVPRTEASIGAWFNIFQFIIIISICTNCVLLVRLYDAKGEWKLSPGIAAILVMEHVLLLIKFGFSRVVPEEPAWVRADRVKNATRAQEVCSKQLLRSTSGGQKMVEEVEKEK